MTSPAADVLHASDRLRATYTRSGAPGAGDRPLVVSFDSLGHDLALDRPGFARGWLEGRGFDAVHIVSARNDWYQAPDLPELLQAVRERAAAYSCAVTYGSSMGGYAAVRFAGRAGARRAVALSPQFSVDPAVRGFDDRWTEHAREIRFLWEAPAPEDAALETAYVVYDPRHADRAHAEALAAAYPVTLVPLPHAGHPAGALLAETGLLAEAVEAMIAGTLDAPALARAVRAARSRAASVHFSLAQRQPPHRARLATRLAARAHELEPDGPAYVAAHARGLASQGRTSEAETLHRRAVAMAPFDSSFHLQLAELLAQRGGAEAEVVELVRGLEQMPPRKLASRLRACGVLIQVGAFEAARGEAQQARRAHPGSPKAQAMALGLDLALATPWAGRAVLERLRRRLRSSRSNGVRPPVEEKA